jgi:predicted DNA-binding protein
MPTHKKRLNITLPKHLAVFLKGISLRDDVPQATKAAELLERALELEEDAYFSKMAEQRDKPNARFISHDKFWDKLL